MRAASPELVVGSFDVLGQELNVDNIKKIEIIRGPGSAIYGANAFFGLINITTLDDINNVRAGVSANVAYAGLRLTFRHAQRDFGGPYNGSALLRYGAALTGHWVR